MRSQIKKKKKGEGKRNEGDEEACELVSVRLVKCVREKVKNREGCKDRKDDLDSCGCRNSDVAVFG